MKIKVSRPVIISFLCGIAAVIFSIMFLHMKGLEVAGGGKARTILVAAHDIDVGIFLERGMVDHKDIPSNFVDQTAISRREEVAGKVTLVPIKKGEQITGAKIASAGEKGLLSPKLEKGTRAVSIILPDSSCAGGLIEPDDHVDIAVTFDYGDEDFSNKYTKIIFQDALVIAVDSRLHSIRNPGGFGPSEKKSKTILGDSNIAPGGRNNSKIITLALGPEEAERLVFAEKAGEVSLLLRSPTDHSLFEGLRTVKAEDLIGEGGFLRKKFKEYRGR